MNPLDDREVFGKQVDYVKELAEADKRLIEKLAELEHEQWAHWMKYFFANLSFETIQRWVKQSKLPYSKLSESEKESDRRWARKVLKIIEVDE